MKQPGFIFLFASIILQTAAFAAPPPDLKDAELGGMASRLAKSLGKCLLKEPALQIRTSNQTSEAVNKDIIVSKLYEGLQRQPGSAQDGKLDVVLSSVRKEMGATWKITYNLKADYVRGEKTCSAETNLEKGNEPPAK